MVPAYEVRELDLATARNQQYIVSNGPSISGVTVLAVPAGVSVSIAFGSTRDYIPISVNGMSFELCPPGNEGVLVTNPASAGVLRLLISYGNITTGA